MKNQRGFTLLELLIVMVIASIMLATGIVSFSRFRKDATLMAEANAIKSRMKSAQNSAINMRLEGEKAVGNCSGPCLENRWLHGVQVDITADNIIARRIYRDTYTGADPDEKKAENSLPTAFPTDYNPTIPYSPGFTSYILDNASGQELSNYQLTEKVKIATDGGFVTNMLDVPDSVDAANSKLCQYVTYVAVNGRMILTNQNDDVNVDSCIMFIYVDESTSDYVLRGIKFDNTGSISICANKKTCKEEVWN